MTANDISRNSLNFSKLLHSEDDPGSDIDDPNTQTIQRISNHQPVKMSIDLTKILAKREEEQRGKRLYVVSKSRSPPRQKSTEKLKSKMKSPATVVTPNIPVKKPLQNPYVVKVQGNDDRVKDLLSKLKQTEDTVQTLQTKIMKRDEKITKKSIPATIDVSESKVKTKKVEKSENTMVFEDKSISKSNPYNSPVTSIPKVMDLNKTPTKMNKSYAKREEKTKSPLKKAQTVEKKVASSFVSGVKITKPKQKKVDDSPIQGRKKSIGSHLLYGVFSPEKKKSPPKTRKKSNVILG
jgi:hypothetical protein